MIKMFSHSVKVPRLYKISAKLAKDVSEGKGSLKELVYTCKHPNLKALYALVAQVFQKSSQIEFLLKKSNIIEKEGRFDPWLAKVLIVELLWGKKRLSGQSKPIQIILGYEQILKAHLSDEVQEERVDLVDKPRYVRVNTLKISVADAINNFRDEGWVLQRAPGSSYLEFLEKVSSLGVEEFMVDFHIPYLLVFPPKTQFYKHDAYLNGSIILQDKASCLPVHMLNPSPASTVLDMCAAPGMKTTQCAALMQNEGQIYAVEINMKRFSTLEKIIESVGATCIKPVNEDVLKLKSDACPNIEYILVDPSCSGSGISDRIETSQEPEPESRLERLAGFQIKILRHALTQFPEAKKVVYSTCSLFPEENEDVVRQVLETCTQFKLVQGRNFVGGEWENFGSLDFGDIGKACLYTRPDVDLTNGFFVAVFERLEEGEKNEFLNAKLFALQKKQLKELKRKEQKEQTKLKQEEDTYELVKTKKEKQFEDYTEIGKDDINKNCEDQSDVIDIASSTSNKKKKKKRKTCEHIEVIVDQNEMNSEKLENGENLQTNLEIDDFEVASSKNKKKRKNKHQEAVVKKTFETIEVVVDQNEASSDKIETDGNLQTDMKNYDVKVASSKKKKKRKNENYVEIVDCEANNFENQEVVVKKAFGTTEVTVDQNETSREKIETDGNLQTDMKNYDVKVASSKKKKKRKNEDYVEIVDCEVNNFENQEDVVIDSGIICSKKEKKKRKKTLLNHGETIEVIEIKDEKKTNCEDCEIIMDDLQNSKITKFKKQKVKKCKRAKEVVELQELDFEVNTENLALEETVDILESDHSKVKKKKNKNNREIFKAISASGELDNQNNAVSFETITDHDQTILETNEKRKKKKHKLISNQDKIEDINGIKKNKKTENLKDNVNLKAVKSKNEKCDKVLLVAEQENLRTRKETQRMHAADFF